MSGSRCIISSNLISPGTVKGIFRNTHQLYMRILHFFQIFHDSAGKLAVIIKSVFRAVGMFHPGTDMAFVYRHRFFIIVFSVSCLHPCVVRPFEFCDIKSFGSISRSHFRIIGKWVGFIKFFSRRGLNKIFIHLIFTDARDKYLMNASRPQFFHRMTLFIPVIECADDMNARRIRRPDRKIHSFNTVFR